MHYKADTPCGPISTPLQASETVAHDAEDFSGLDRLKERLAAETKDPGQSNGTNQPLEACNHEILNINAQICSNIFWSSSQSHVSSSPFADEEEASEFFGLDRSEVWQNQSFASWCSSRVLPERNDVKAPCRDRHLYICDACSISSIPVGLHVQLGVWQFLLQQQFQKFIVSCQAGKDSWRLAYFPWCWARLMQQSDGQGGVCWLSRGVSKLQFTSTNFDVWLHLMRFNGLQMSI